MLIINRWGLDENTKSGIKNKEKLERIELSSTVISNSSDDEDNDYNDNNEDQSSQKNNTD